ncbi:MAG: GGDEF domain-containing protein [Acidiferrobacterales bacterium]
MTGSSQNRQEATLDLSLLARSDRLRLLYRQSFPALFVSFLAALVLLAILWNHQDHRLLLTWFGTLFLTSVIRLALFVLYRRSSPQGQELLAWERPYFITLILSSLTWGIGSLLIMPEGSLVLQAITFSFLVGLAGGAISVYSSHSVMTIGAIASILLPATVYFLFSGTNMFVGMAIGAILFFASSVRASRFLGVTLNQNFLMTRQLDASRRQAEKLANTDDLTGLYTRRAFYELGKVLSNGSRRSAEPVSMIVMDIDNFKEINDSFGHAAGDSALMQVGRIFKERLRRSDISGRIGGEEFAVLLPGTSIEQSVQLAEQLRKQIEELTIPAEEKNIKITASFGVASGVDDLDTLGNHADKAMYQSKQSGRNAVTAFE